MKHQELVYTETQEGFEINLYLLPEEETPDWDFESAEEKEELLHKIENGQLLWFVAKVTASKAGVELGVDYLGGCCNKNMKEFIADGYYADMKAEAIYEAHLKLKALIK